MFKNEANQLKKENDKNTRWMAEEDEDIIDKIMESIGIFRVNSFDTQVIRRDLIAMAREARLRKSDMNEVIGDDIKLTTYDIIKNSRGSSKQEILFLYLRFITGIVFISYGFFGTLNFTNFSWEIGLAALFGLVYTASYYFLISKLVRPLLNMEGWGRLGFYWTMLTAIPTYYYAAIFGAYGAPMYARATIYVSKAYVLVAAGIIFFVSDYFYRKNIRELAMGKSNYYEDLTELENQKK